jgi:hypothetical protein
MNETVRAYRAFDCLGCYVWIWERLIRTRNGDTKVVARRVYR